MIYLILDTNIWLYLANGYDPETSGNQDTNLHFELLSQLRELNAKMDICVLVNDIILKEWERNKHHAQHKIEKLKRKLENLPLSTRDVLQYTDMDADKLMDEMSAKINEEIQVNEEHIKSVEDFLYQECEKVEIEDTLKIKMFDLSLENKAPFQSKKNNIADASILFSSDNFLREKLLLEETSAIFISNNYRDFTDGVNKTAFHPEILEQLVCKDLQYQRVLPAALKLSTKIIEEIREYHRHEAYLESISFNCLTPLCQATESLRPWGYTDKELPVKWESIETRDPNQTSLFPELEVPMSERERTIESGNCVICSTLHLSCPVCKEFFYVETPNERFACPECHTELEIQFNEEEDKSYIQIMDVNDSEVG